MTEICEKCGTASRYANGQCRHCLSAAKREHRKNNPDVVASWKRPSGACVKCGVDDRSPSGGCRPCNRICRKRYTANNPDKLKAYRRTPAVKKRRNEANYSKRWREANPEKYAESVRLRYERNPTYTRDIRIKRKYNGMTADDYEALFERQGRMCAMPGCGSKTPGVKGRKHFAVDHCHKTGKVRGLLCNACNVGLGQFRDDRARLIGAIAYLDAHHPVTV